MICAHERTRILLCIFSTTLLAIGKPLENFCKTKELNIGKVLGRGGFCVVNQVERITLAVTEDTESNVLSGDEHFIHNVVQDRGFMARHCIRTKNKKKDYRYAIKRVQDKSKKDPQDYVNAVIDLATEARFLAVVRHANIIKMRATEDASPYTSGYFLVLDKLFDIMPTRLKIWKKKEGGSLKKMLKSKDSQKALWMERLSVAYDLACALSYLHGMRYVAHCSLLTDCEIHWTVTVSPLFTGTGRWRH